MSANNLATFLKKHICIKGEQSPTHTRIGDAKLNIYGGSYFIPETDLDEFHNLYFISTFKDEHLEYLTEKQDANCIAIDIDFRYSHEINKRQHDISHIQDILTILYIPKIREITGITELF